MSFSCKTSIGTRNLVPQKEEWKVTAYGKCVTSTLIRSPNLKLRHPKGTLYQTYIFADDKVAITIKKFAVVFKNFMIIKNNKTL